MCILEHTRGKSTRRKLQRRGLIRRRCPTVSFWFVDSSFRQRFLLISMKTTRDIPSLGDSTKFGSVELSRFSLLVRIVRPKFHVFVRNGCFRFRRSWPLRDSLRRVRLEVHSQGNSCIVCIYKWYVCVCVIVSLRIRLRVHMSVRVHVYVCVCVCARV